MHTLSASEEQNQIVKGSLFDFITSHVHDADLDAVDDVIVSYVVATIDAVRNTPEDFYLHVDELVDIMSPYVKEFERINRDAVYIWLYQILGTDKNEAAKPSDKKDMLSFHIPKEPAQPDSNESSRSNSTSQSYEFKYPVSSVHKVATRKQIQDFESAVEATKKHAASLPPGSEPFRIVLLRSFLTEMFPGSSPMEVNYCASISMGDLESALAALLYRRENGLELTAGSLPARTNKLVAADSTQVKNRIIERYSYVDRESESREHKPLAPKNEPKKMVRYRDNKIVSLKGERYTEVSKGDDEGVKKTNKKHHP